MGVVALGFSRRYLAPGCRGVMRVVASGMCRRSPMSWMVGVWPVACCTCRPAEVRICGRGQKVTVSSTVVVLPQASVAVIVTLCGFPVGLKRERSMVNDARAVLPSSLKKGEFPVDFATV